MDIIVSRRECPAGFIIPTIIVAMDQFVQAPEVILSTGKWPHIPDIVNVMDHDIRNHCWFQLEKSQKKVDKGKGKAVELPHNTVAGPSGMMEKEVKGDGSEVGEPWQTAISTIVPEDQKGESNCIGNDDNKLHRGRSQSQGCKTRKWAQSVTTINSNEDSAEVSSNPPPKQPRPNVRDMVTPDPGYEWVETENRCTKCVEQGRQCATCRKVVVCTGKV